MSTMTAVNNIPPLSRAEATRLAATETERMADALAALDDADWGKQTDCPLWTVRDMAGHVVGMTITFSSLGNFVSHMRAGGKAAGDGPMLDALTAVQVQRNAGLSTTEVVARLREVGPRSAAWRASRRLMRKIPMKQPMPDGSVETWKFAYLVDTILTRDTWMHRVDVARATGKSMTLTAQHDGRIVGDAVAEWARRHGKPFALNLTGPAGGEYANGESGEEIDIDAVEFCRILSGRGEGAGLLSKQVPF